MVERPLGGDGVVFWRTFRLCQVVVHPRAMPPLAGAVVEIHPLPPRTRVEHLVGVSVTDVAVENVLRHRAGDEVEL